MPITALPDPPTRQDPANFAVRADEFLAALPDFATEANALATDVNAKQVTASNAATTATTQAGIATTQAGDAATSAGMAYASELAAQAAASTAANAPGTNATSTSSVAIGTGSKSLTVQTGKLFVPGQYVMIARTSAPDTQWMTGSVTSYNSGTGALAVTTTLAEGSGTFTDWTVSLTGPVNSATVSLNKFGAQSTAGTLDWNDATNTQPGGGPTLLLGTATNGPGGGLYYHALTFEYGITRDGSGQLTQFALPYSIESSSGAMKMWVRGRYTGVWTPWELIGGVEEVRLVSTPTTVSSIGVTHVFTASTTLTLPLNTDVKQGYAVNIVNRSGTLTCVVARNGSNIMDLAENLTLDDVNANVRLVYVDVTRGWVLV